MSLWGVHKTYGHGPEATHAVRGVTLHLTAGSFTAIIGQSGSGKSSLLNCAAGLDRPSQGRVVVGGVDLNGLSDHALTVFRRDQIGFVFQAYNLIGHLSVRENLQLPLTLAGAAPDAAWLGHLIRQTGLDGLMDRRPSQLSGGQAQRVAIARALITRPAVVFADEPTGALDSATGDAVMNLLRRTATELGQTIVLVTHDQRVAAVADHVVEVCDGRVLRRGAA